MKVDRITFVAYWRRNAVKKNSLGEYTHVDECLAPLLSVSRRSFAKYPYRYRFTTDHGVTIEIADKKTNVPPIRFDFNPQTADYIPVLNQFAGCLEYQRVTRLDYCQDYQFNFDGLYISTENAVSSCLFLSAGGKLETKYLGARSSDHRYRIYNKALESGLDTVLWRIEVQMRFRPDEHFSDRSPFGALVFSSPETPQKIQERAMLEYLMNHPESWGELSSGSKAKYKKMLKGNPSKLFDISGEFHPENIYLQEKRSLVDYVYNVINITGQLD